MKRPKRGLPKRPWKPLHPDLLAPPERLEDIPIPPEVDKLRDARKAIAPWQVYRLAMPDGSIYEVTGADLIKTADRMVALADAQRRGDEDGVRRAVERIAEHDWGGEVPS